MSTIEDCFDQPGYKALQQLESLLAKAAREEEYPVEVAFVLDRYGDDLMESSLKVQLESFTTAFIPAAEKAHVYCSQNIHLITFSCPAWCNVRGMHCIEADHGYFCH